MAFAKLRTSVVLSITQPQAASLASEASDGRNSDEWQAVWKKKGKMTTDANSIDELLKADGFEGGQNAVKMHTYAAKRLSQEVKDGDVVAEVASGSGPVIFMVQELLKARGVKASTVGFDYARELIALGTRYARRLPKEHAARSTLFFQGDMRHMDYVLDATFNVNFMVSALQYMDGEDESRRVVEEMIRVTTRPGKVLVFDIQDMALKDECLKAREKANYAAHQQKTGVSSSKLKRNFVSRSSIAAAAKNKGCTLSIENTKDFVSAADYINTPCSYNAIITCPGS